MPKRIVNVNYLTELDPEKLLFFAQLSACCSGQVFCDGETASIPGVLSVSFVRPSYRR